MKNFIFVSTLFITLHLFAQDSLPAPALQPNTATHLLSKGDSLMAVIAAKQGIDTNATAAEIGALIDDSLKLAPGKHAGPLAWWKFVISLIAVIAAGWFFVKHQLLKNKVGVSSGAKVPGAKSFSPLLVMGLLALNSCSITKTSVTPYGGMVTEQISKNGYYLQEDIAIHTAPFQNDTAAILVFGPDSVTNPLIQDITNYVKSKLAGK